MLTLVSLLKLSYGDAQAPDRLRVSASLREPIRFSPTQFIFPGEEIFSTSAGLLAHSCCNYARNTHHKEQLRRKKQASHSVGIFPAVIPMRYITVSGLHMLPSILIIYIKKIIAVTCPPLRSDGNLCLQEMSAVPVFVQRYPPLAC